MFLKSLEIQGFKSFADKMTFDFSPGVTAIVGPNGSGKSNVVDAIRWVLGEQSAKTLRGSKMEDVIFAGSDGRRPVGMAKVTMVLDNASRTFPLDADEVEVSRTLYRSGESVYMLNRHTCRLKDIQELFMDTGLGKDGFSVIGQGKIEEILTLRAEDRRGLIEEAAGISKYKYRKREAERRLEATNEDMTRLDDILYELEERVEPLRIQAEKVKQYRSLKGQADQLQIDLLAQEYTNRSQAAEKLTRQGEEAHTQALALDARRDQLAADAVAARARLDAKREETEDIQNAFYESLRLQESLLRDHKLLAQQIETDRSRLQDLSQTQLEQARALETARDQEKILAQKAQANDEERGRLSLQVSQQQEKAQALTTEIERLNASIASLEEAQFDAFSRQAANNNESARLSQALSSGKERRQRLDKRLEDLKKEQAQAQKELDGFTAKRASLDEQSRELTEKLRQAADRNVQAGEEAGRLERLEREAEQKLSSVKSRLQTLEEFESSGEGYYQGVQAVLRARTGKKLSGIHGSVLQLLDIPDPYLSAIDSALGAAAQNLVVENDRDAQAAIAWLKKGRLGRATFMPLNMIRGSRQIVHFDDETVIGLAADLVQYDPAYDKVVAQLLGHIWVVKDLAGAVRVSRHTGSKYRFVTLDGEVIAAGGSMTGGFQKKRNTLVTRKKEMRQLNDEVAKLQDALRTLAGQLQEANETVSATRQEMSQAQTALQSVRLGSNEYDVRLQQAKAAVDKLDRDMQLETMDQEMLTSDHERLNRQLDQSVANARSLETELADIRQALEKARTDLTAAQKEGTQAQKVLEEMRIRQAALDEQAQSASARYAELSQRLQELSRRSASQTEEKRLLETDLQAKEGQAEDLAEKLEASQKDHAQLQETLAAGKNELSALEAASRALDEESAACGRQSDKAWRDYNSLTARTDSMRDKLETIVGRIRETFLITPEECLKRAQKDRDLRGAQKELEGLRQSIQSLGQINFTALEEYQQVQERSAFLKDQLDDLHTAKEKLETVIHEMETTMSRRFKEVFEQVNTHFQRVFIAMFGGGSARLELSVPGKYLETGVEIIAQPPGKGERLLSLLSGGERALTAIALLFALLEVHPSPFVILDEIEAALDEANVERFAAFIGKYSANTQFIVISHRRGTMEAAAYLYGITMDKNGVSKQISVRVSDYK
jgi:chromosome segregation protein